MKSCWDSKEQHVYQNINYQTFCNSLLHLFIPVCFSSDCSFNQASNNSISSLPADLAKCSKLTKLDVEVLTPDCLTTAWWFLYSFALRKSCLTIHILLYSCQGNKLTTLPESLVASCRMLTELNACKNSEYSIFSVLSIDSYYGTAFTSH